MFLLAVSTYAHDSVELMQTKHAEASRASPVYVQASMEKQTKRSMYGSQLYQDTSMYRAKTMQCDNGFFKCMGITDCESEYGDRGYHKIFISKKPWMTQCEDDHASFEDDANTIFPFMFEVADRLCAEGYSLYLDWLDFEAASTKIYWTGALYGNASDFVPEHIDNVRRALANAVHRMEGPCFTNAAMLAQTRHHVKGKCDAKEMNKRRMYVTVGGSPSDGPYSVAELCAFSGEWSTDPDCKSFHTGASNNSKNLPVYMKKLPTDAHAIAYESFKGKSGGGKCPGANEFAAAALDILSSGS